jgi:hypothetical protein
MHAAGQEAHDAQGGRVGQGPPSPWSPTPIRSNYPDYGGEDADPRPPATAATAAHKPRCKNLQATKN